jgi:glycosyltransferase involved in cell wall biosynthesis
MIAPLEIASYELGGLRHQIGVRLYTSLQRWALTECDVLVRFTQSAVRALEEYYHLPLQAKSVAAVYVSREFDRAQASSGPVQYARPEPRELIWVGGLIKSKNVDFLLRAVARLARTDWILNICSDGPERPRLEALARTLAVADRTRFSGAVADIAAEYGRASMLLTGSVLEQYSLTLMEAYAFGVPCIGLRPDWKTVFNSNEDQIIEGETGFVVSNETEMADRIAYLLEHEAERQRMGERGHAFKQRSFSFEAYYAAMKALVVG